MKNKFILKTPFFYGWLIVFIGGMGLFFSGPGQTFSVSIFINYYIEEFGWSRSLISTFYSSATLAAGFILPFIGRLIDKKGHRTMIIIIASALGITSLWMSFVFNPIMLIIGFFFLRLFGQGSMTLLPQTLIPQWFIKKRGLALSLMGLGGVVGSALIPSLNNQLILNLGTNFTWRFWSVLLIALMAPLGWVLIRNKPEDVGFLPDNMHSKQKLKKIKEKKTEDFKDEHSWTLKESMSTRVFWFMLFCMIIPSMINTGITFHIVSIIQEKGFSSTYAAFLLSLAAMIQFPFTFLAGYISDKFKINIVKAFNYLFLLIAMIIITFSDSQMILLLYSLSHGIFMAFDSVSTGVLWPNYFGRKHLGSIRGVAMTTMVIGSSLGPLPFGFAFDIFNSYTQIMLLMMIFPILGFIASFISPAPDYHNHFNIKKPI